MRISDLCLGGEMGVESVGGDSRQQVVWKPVPCALSECPRREALT